MGPVEVDVEVEDAFYSDACDKCSEAMVVDESVRCWELANIELCRTDSHQGQGTRVMENAE